MPLSAARFIVTDDLRSRPGSAPGDQDADENARAPDNGVRHWVVGQFEMERPHNRLRALSPSVLPGQCLMMA